MPSEAAPARAGEASDAVRLAKVCPPRPVSGISSMQTAFPIL
ncbi:hypothetical protein [Neisseria meningitidis]|nr:hypothetical protein [Neisseria meningitidis]